MLAHPVRVCDVLLGQRHSTSISMALQAKLVRGRRGGYCFEHATLSLAALAALGFRSRCGAPRAHHVRAAHGSMRTHMFLGVLVPNVLRRDPGFGASYRACR